MSSWSCVNEVDIWLYKLPFTLSAVSREYVLNRKYSYLRSSYAGRWSKTVLRGKITNKLIPRCKVSLGKLIYPKLVYETMLSYNPKVLTSFATYPGNLFRSALPTCCTHSSPLPPRVQHVKPVSVIYLTNVNRSG